MNRRLFIFPLLAFSLCYGQPSSPLSLARTASGKHTLYFPPRSGNDWATLSPETLNLDTPEIRSLSQFLEENLTQSFILLKDGKMVIEKYYGRANEKSWHVWNSAAKSLMATMVGIAQAEGLLDIHDKTSDYLGMGWTSMPREQENKITLWHHLTMTGGMRNNILTFNCIEPKCLLYKTDAGTEWSYHNSLYILLKNVLETASSQTLNQFGYTRIHQKIGMRGRWSRSFNRIVFYSSARDMARFGILIQNEGVWDGTAVLDDPAYFSEMVSSSQQLNPAYGYMWWLNGKIAYVDPNSQTTIGTAIAPEAPEDLIVAAGAKGQFIAISPGQGLIMVRQGSIDGNDLAALAFHNELWKKLQAWMAD